MKQTEECVVYKITNKINNRIYIGVTVNFTRRMQEHKRCPNKKMLKDNYSDMTQEIIFQGTEDDCYKKEIELIEKLSPYYNTCLGGRVGGTGSGENHPSAKLTNIEAMEIRYLFNYVDDYNANYLGTIYNVTPDTIRNIVTGRVYPNALGPIIDIKENMNGENNPAAKITGDIVINIRNIAFEDRNTSKYTHKIISKIFNIERVEVTRIINGTRWKEVEGPILGIDYNKKCPRNSGESHGKAKATNEIVRQIRQRAYMTKDSARIISLDYPIAGSTINQIISGITWGNAPGPIKGKDYQKRGEGLAKQTLKIKR